MAMKSASDRMGFFVAMFGWLGLLLGQRIVLSPEGASKLFTILGIAGIVGSCIQRGIALGRAREENKAAARAFLGLSVVGVFALAGYYATSIGGRELFGIKPPALTGEDAFGDVVTLAWLALATLSVVPAALGELSRASMRHAERQESRRVLSAIAAGLALSCVAVYGALFTFAADKTDKSVDYSYYRVGRPSASTGKMIDGLSEPLEVFVFFAPTTEVRSQVMSYLDELKRGREAKLVVTTHDFQAEPKLAKEHKLTKDGVLVLQRGKVSQKLDIGIEEDKARRTLKKIDGEFQKVLMKLVRDKRTAYVTVGHGELVQETDKRTERSAEIVKQLIEMQNYGVKNLGLGDGLGSAIPDDAAVVLVLGPTTAFAEAEVETLRRYADGGGKLLLALDPESQAAHGPLAAIAGIDWQPALVVSEKPTVRMTGGPGDKKVLASNSFSSHASVSTLSKEQSRGAYVVMSGAAALEKLKDLDKSYAVDFGVKSPRGSFLDTNADLSPGGDEKKAVFNLFAAVTRKLGDGKDALELRSVVVGDADVFGDFFAARVPGNQVLFAEALRWLGGEESFTGRTSSEEDVSLAHTKATDQLYFYGTILGAPSLVLAAGFYFTVRPRRRQKPKAEVKSGSTLEAKGEPKSAPKTEATGESKSEATMNADGES
ncbi:MAG: hypothetical protein EXR75_10030 [Myxococcales bacterium]|nr:hypothetical protein [Myxococcales bacterium]